MTTEQESSELLGCRFARELFAVDASPCLESKLLVGACFTVHGRLTQSNGAPSFRIWRVGTNRILGVVDGDGKDESDNAIPLNVQKVGGRYVDIPVFGDYVVCPLTSERPGWMQMVCIQSATNLVGRKSN